MPWCSESRRELDSRVPSCLSFGWEGTRLGNATRTRFPAFTGWSRQSAELRAYTDGPRSVPASASRSTYHRPQMQIKEQKHDIAFIRHPYDSDLGRGASITIGHLPIWCEPQDIPSFLRMEPGFELSAEERVKLVRHLEDRPRHQKGRSHAHAPVVRAAMVFLQGEGLLDGCRFICSEQARAVEREVRRLCLPEEVSGNAKAPLAVAEASAVVQAIDLVTGASSAPVEAGRDMSSVPLTVAASAALQDHDRRVQLDSRVRFAWRRACTWARRVPAAFMARVPNHWVAGYMRWRQSVAPYV